METALPSVKGCIMADDKEIKKLVPVVTSKQYRMFLMRMGATTKEADDLVRRYLKEGPGASSYRNASLKLASACERLGIGIEDFYKMLISYEDPGKRNIYSVPMNQSDLEKRRAALDDLRAALQDGIKHYNSLPTSGAYVLRMDDFRISWDWISVGITLHEKTRQKAVR